MLSNYSTGWRRLRLPHQHSFSLIFKWAFASSFVICSMLRARACAYMFVYVASHLLFSERRWGEKLETGLINSWKKGIKGFFPAILFVEELGFTCSVIEGGCSALPLSLIITSLQKDSCCHVLVGSKHLAITHDTESLINDRLIALHSSTKVVGQQ